MGMKPNADASGDTDAPAMRVSRRALATKTVTLAAALAAMPADRRARALELGITCSHGVDLLDPDCTYRQCGDDVGKR